MATVFLDVATLPDSSGRFRAQLVLATRLYGGSWSESAIADYIRRAPRPTKALEVSDSEYDKLAANPGLCRGYIDKPGDLDSPFEPYAHGWSAI